MKSTKILKHSFIYGFLTTLIVLTVLLSYVATQQPKFWCDRQWAGIALYKGGYRSWTLYFCDGFAVVDNKLQPVVLETNGLRTGYFRWPVYRHVNLKKLGIPPP